MKSTSFILLICGLVFDSHGWSQSLSFELQGMAESGVSAANEPADVIDGGSGDIGAGGISLDLSTNHLFVDVEWGSGNGYIDLSSDIDFMNIHGPTSLPAPTNFTESAETFTGLGGFNASAVNGGYIGTTSFDGDIKGLLEGRYYIHLHTFVNGGGEARGYLIPEVVLGDINNDGLINLLDVSFFVAVVSDGQFVDAADTNRDGQINLLDVDGFVQILAN